MLLPITRRTILAWLVLFAVTTTSCDRLKGKKKTSVQHKKAVASASASAASSGVTAGHPPAPSASAHAASGHAAKGHAAKGHAAKGEAAGSGFALPFAWEASENAPLSRARGFLRETFRDNRDYMKHGPKFFDTFAKAQKPRATVVACADSRVQSAAWDLTPENDDFTIRNIGNQLTNSLGSVEYGIEHLNTPVLLIVGHTGCGAVKAAMGDKSSLSPEIRKEIDPLVLPKEFEGQTSDSAWTKAVIANVHAQVSVALTRFAPFIHEGRLTVVGVVYDFRDDLGNGAGKIAVVSVNGNSEEERLSSFVDAIVDPTKRSRKPGEGNGSVAGSTDSYDTGASVEQVTEKLKGLLEKGNAPPTKEGH